MLGQPPGRIFISYSRKDGAEFARDLRTTLEKEDLSVWQDLVALEGGEDWWAQIERVLRSKDLQHFILVITPAALDSAVVKQEIRLARQEGKSVSPVRGPGVLDLNKLPRWLGHTYDLAIPEQKNALFAKLKREAEPRRAPMMAPELPPDFVARPKEFDGLKARLLDPEGDSIAGITAALRGAGGYGKTTLAKALARDPDIQDAYFDGILWAELGEKPERLIATLADLVTLLSDERPQLETPNAAAAKLGETLGDRRILMVIDDVWRKQDLEPFLHGGRHCVRLVTTRIDSVLPQEALRQKVDAMQGSEALSLLSGGLPQDQATRERAGLEKLAVRLGEWPLLLTIVNGFLRNRVAGGEPLPVAVAGANKRLDAKGLTVFDARDETQRANAVVRTIGVSLDLLSGPEPVRFAELGVFPEGADIPIGVVARLWAATGGLADFETDDLLERLFDLSLLLERNLDQRFFRLHDTVRHFLRDQTGKERLVPQHRALITILEDPSDAADERTRRYPYRSLLHHLAEAGERNRLDALLLDPAWLMAKLAATGNPLGLVLDYQQYGAGEAQNLVGRTLRLINGILARDGRQLPLQLADRLARVETVGIPAFVDKARGLIPRPAIVPLWQSLTPPGAETARLEGHANPVAALCLLPDGRLASGSFDRTIRLWDVATGTETARFEGHASWVTALCMLPGGQLASGSLDGTIRLWDVPAGAAETARLEGHTGRVAALCLLPDGRLASGSHDNTIRLWDAATGAETARLEGHLSGVAALCRLPDGRLASGSFDQTIRLWNVATGAETARLKGHSHAVTALCLLPDGRLASGSHDSTIRLWDLAAGAEATSLKGHIDQVTALCLLPDGRLASGSGDNTIRLWDVAGGVETARLEGHSNEVAALCLLSDGLASGSWDNTIRLWDAATGAATGRLEGHKNAVTALCLLPGRLASGSWDNTIRLWDVATGTESYRLEGANGITALCLLPDGRLASASDDKTIRLWDLATGAETARLEGHTGQIATLCLLPDGRLASASDDRTIRLWDLATGAETARLEGHTGQIATLCLLPDGRLASGSFDQTIRLWNLSTGTETARLEGHSHPVAALCLLADGRLASACWDNTIWLWDVATGAKSAHLEGRTPCLLPSGRLASSGHNIIRLWDVEKGSEIARLEIDAPVMALIATAPNCIAAGDGVGRLHWLEILD
jgi:WD40 repeat protein